MAKFSTNELFTSSGKYPDRAKSPELTDEVKKNAEELIKRVNALMVDLAWSTPLLISSGFRPSEVNAGIANAAKKSLHQVGKAIDIVDDKDQSLYKRIEKSSDLLKKHGLWMEHGDATRGKNTNWVHLDFGDRKDRAVRIFKP